MARLRGSSWAVLGTLAATVCLAGCGGDGLANLHGTVTIAGRPLADGTINFEPTNRQGPTAGAVVHQGLYQLRLRPGDKVVRIEGYETIGERPFNPADPNSAMIPTKKPIVAAKYNSQSMLSCRVEPAGGQQDFALEAQ